MVSHIDVLGVGASDGVLRKLHCTLVVLEHWNARHPYIRQHKTSNLPKKSTSLAMSPSATYSASVMESMTNFCVLENQLTHAPAHITNPPDTDLLSAALLAWSASAKACRFKGPRRPYYNPTSWAGQEGGECVQPRLHSPLYDRFPQEFDNLFHRHVRP